MSSIKQAIADMPDVGRDDDFARPDDRGRELDLSDPCLTPVRVREPDPISLSEQSRLVWLAMWGKVREGSER